MDRNRLLVSHRREGYGLTECSAIISLGDENDPHPGTIGKALPSVEHVVRDLDTGGWARSGRHGMHLARGPSMFERYLNNDGEPPFVTFKGKRWYRTGDLVGEDADGVLTFRGRLKRFVKLGGEMISLPAVEAVLQQRCVSEADEGPVLVVEATPNEEHPELVLFTTRDLDRQTAMQAFAKYRNNAQFSAEQIRFVTLVIDYRTQNGVMEPERLYQPPCTDFSPTGVEGMFADVETDRIIKLLQTVRRNAEARASA